MPMRVTNEWLRRRIEADPDVETEAGLPITKAEVLQAFLPAKGKTEPARAQGAAEESVLGTLLRQLRRRDNMQLARLAAEARVPEAELQAIEQDRSFMPKPRTIHQLAVYYKISPRALLKLSPAAAERDGSLDEAALRFAASAENLAKLDRDERNRLNEFIKVLSNYKEQPVQNAD